MAKISLIFSFFSSYILLSMLSVPSVAAGERQVQLLEIFFGGLLETERSNYCNLCTYVCPRLFGRIKDKRESSIYENVDRDAANFLRPIFTPLVRYFLEYS